MTNAGKIKAAFIVALTAGLTACQGMGGQPPYARGPVAVAPAPSGPFDGDWLSTDGVAYSRFNNGIFETLATDTGNRLAEGNYFQSAPNTVSISVTSLIRQTTTQVNCALVTQTQLNCTSSTGQQFSLIRRGASV